MTRNITLRLIFILGILFALILTLADSIAIAQKVQPVAASAADLVWPLPPDKPRIRFLGMYNNNFDIEPRKKRSWVDKLVGNPDPNVLEIFEKPAGVAIDSRGRIIIASIQLGTVFVLDKDKNSILQIRGGRGIELMNPLGLAVDKNDNIFVSDPILRMVLKFDPQGNLLATIGQDPPLQNPVYLALDETRRRLFLVDSHLHQVLVYDLDTLKLITKVGKRGTKNGEFNYPVGVGVSRDGYFAVSDTGSCSVQIFSPDFKFVRRFGSQGTRPGDFVRPKGVAYDNEGHIYVVDAAFNNFQIFNSKGQVLMFIGGFGIKPGEFNLPNGISINAKDQIIVSDQLNSRVQIFQFLGGN
jgi:DNA-binding beta-propeller fold protein YncE